MLEQTVSLVQLPRFDKTILKLTTLEHATGQTSNDFDLKPVKRTNQEPRTRKLELQHFNESDPYRIDISQFCSVLSFIKVRECWCQGIQRWVQLGAAKMDQMPKKA